MSTRTIAVIGSGVAGWSAACALGRVFSSSEVRITFIDNEQADSFVAEYAGAYIHDFNDMLGISLRELIAETHSTLSYGTRFQDWAFLNQDFLLPESALVNANGVGFEQIFAAAKRVGLSKNIDDFFLPSVAAKAGRFGFPVKNSDSIYSNLQFGINLDLEGYTRLIAKTALSSGVFHIKGRVSAIGERDSVGNVKSLVLESGKECAADLYIDFSDDGDLVKRILAFPENKNTAVPVFTQLTVGSVASDSEFKPCAEWLGVGKGVAQIIPLREKKLIAFHALSELDTSTELVVRDVSVEVWENKKTANSNCCVEQPWVANVVAMGKAAFNMPVTPWGEFKWSRHQIVRFVELFIGFDVIESSASEYNRLFAEEYSMITELAALTYFIGSTNNKSFVEFFNRSSLMPEVKHRLQLYSSSTRHASINEQIVSLNQLGSFFLGNNIIPEWSEFTYGNNTEDQLLKYCQNLYSVSQSATLNLPSYSDCMHQYLMQKHQ